MPGNAWNVSLIFFWNWTAQDGAAANMAHRRFAARTTLNTPGTAVMAIVLPSIPPIRASTLKVLKMLLIHDVVDRRGRHVHMTKWAPRQEA